jgi:hypothetical protein
MPGPTTVVGAIMAVSATGILTLASSPSHSPAATRPDGCCGLPRTRTVSTEQQYPYAPGGNPTGVKGLGSPDQNAEEGTLRDSQRQVDAEVGAGERDAERREQRRTPTTAPRAWVKQTLVVSMAGVVVCVALAALFVPGEYIPRMGSQGIPARASADSRT